MEMNRYRKHTGLAALVLFLSVVCRLPVQASDIQKQMPEIRLESVQAQMPEMNIYCYPSDASMTEHMEVAYGKEKLTVDSIVPFQETGEGISYYMMMDVSASISAEYFQQMKEAVIQFQQNMQKEDDLTLITFGNGVKVVCQNCPKTENLAASMEDLQNTDENTLLFQAIQKTAELADKQEDKMKRKAALVVTDGEDFSQNTATQAEALSTLQEKSIPLYGLAVREMSGDRENPYIDSMGEFARSSGGILEIFGQEEAVSKMHDMQEMFYQAYVIRAKADSNHVSYTTQPLTITFRDGQVQTMDYMAVYYTKDTEAPKAQIRKISDRELEVSFSEPVVHGEIAANYQVTIDEKQPLSVYQVSYTQEDGAKAVLSFEKELVNGTYQIAFSHITDDSMEENPLKETCSIEITDGAEREEESEKESESFLEKNQGFVAGGILGVLLLIAAGAAWCVIKRRKGLVTVEGKAVLAENLTKKHHVAVEKKQVKGHEIRFLLEGAAGDKNEISAEVQGSLFVGRSSICDIYVDDKKMSKQHFVIYDREDGFDIEDLCSTNGTKINGNRIYTRTRLKQGDKIKAGEIQMTVRW